MFFCVFFFSVLRTEELECRRRPCGCAGERVSDLEQSEGHWWGDVHLLCHSGKVPGPADHPAVCSTYVLHRLNSSSLFFIQSVSVFFFFTEPPQVSISEEKLVLRTASPQVLRCHCSKYYPLSAQVCCLITPNWWHGGGLLGFNVMKMFFFCFVLLLSEIVFFVVVVLWKINLENKWKKHCLGLGLGLKVRVKSKKY